MNEWKRMNTTAMMELLRTALAGELPGRSAQRWMAHRLAYGRHHGPIPAGARKAAVLLALQRSGTGWSLPAILRSETMKTHAGQVSLPGGLMEADETVAQTALREFEEELGGAAADRLQVVGQLSPVYVFVSDFEVTPVVAVCDGALEFAPNPQEVAAVVDLPLDRLTDPNVRGEHLIERRGLSFTVPHFAIAGQRIWGATSLILAEFVAVLHSK
jgi:8-oxo-dGTP pyrophosphatase MutT (NUDIX family)